MGLTKVTYSMIEGATFNVLDYGADSTGSNDSSSAIQAAITAAGYGGCVYFPKGTYKVNSTIDVPAVNSTISGVNFIGEGPSTRIIVGVNGITSLFNITGTNTKFTNITIDANSTDVTNGFNVSVSSNSDLACTVQECTIIGFPRGINATGQNHYYENNFFLNNTRHIRFADDGRNTSISGNYMLGGNIGIEFNKVTQQAEGVRILNNTILCTVGNGSGITIKAGLEFSIIANIIDQTGPNSPGIYIPVASGNAASSIKMISNWIAAGEGSYGVFAHGNNSHLIFTDNTFVSNNSLISLSAIALANTNTFNINSNRFLMTYSGATQDISTSGTSNSTVLGNNSSLAGSNALLNKFNSQVETATSLYADNYVYAQAYNIGLTGPVLLGGNGAPTATLPSGSIWMRTDGGVSNRIYVSQGGGSWLAIAGV